MASLQTGHEGPCNIPPAVRSAGEEIDWSARWNEKPAEGMRICFIDVRDNDCSGFEYEMQKLCEKHVHSPQNRNYFLGGRVAPSSMISGSSSFVK